MWHLPHQVQLEWDQEGCSTENVWEAVADSSSLDEKQGSIELIGTAVAGAVVVHVWLHLLLMLHTWQPNDFPGRTITVDCYRTFDRMSGLILGLDYWACLPCSISPCCLDKVLGVIGVGATTTVIAVEM